MTEVARKIIDNSPFWEFNNTANRYAVERCREQNCEIVFGQDISCKLIVDVEEYWSRSCKRGKVSDCLIFCIFRSRKKIAIVELKSKSPHVLEVRKKMQNVSDAITEFVEEQSLDDFDFYPILLSKSMGPTETKLLRAARIVFRNHSELMIRERCNSLLDNILKKYE